MCHPSNIETEITPDSVTVKTKIIAESRFIGLSKDNFTLQKKRKKILLEACQFIQKGNIVVVPLSGLL
jgi:hypothetical protein